MVDGKQLYFPDDKEYVIYGAKLTETLSCASEFEFVMPSCNPMYDSLEERVSMVQILRNGKEIFYGEVREVNETINKEKSVYCVDEFAFLYDSVQPQARFQNVTPAQFFREILNVHNAKVDPKKRFQAGIVTVTDSNDSIYRYTNGEDTLTAIRKKLCEPLNGYLRKRKEDGITYIDLVNLSDYGVSSVQPVEFGQNLLKYSSKRNGTEIVTVCVPRGARLESQEVKGLDAYVSISSVNDGKNYVVNQKALEHYGWIEKLVEWDDVTQPANLKKKAQEWVDNNQYKILSLELKAVDLAELNANLDPYEVGDMIQAIAEPFGMDAWFPLAKKVTNINDSITNDVTLSYDVKLSYAQNQNIKFENMEQAIPQSTNILESAKENASALIKNSAEGNIFTVYDENRNPKELLIMDTNDIKTAKKVWRWNVNGLAYSSTGYDGEYKLAMTIDGAFVADFITAGTLSADRIRNGTLVSESDGKIVSIGKGIVSFSDSSEIKCIYESDYGDVEATAIAFGVNSNHTGIFMNIAASDLDISCDHIRITSTGNLPYEFAFEIDAITKFLQTAYIKSGAVITSDKDCKTDISELDCEKTAKFIYSLKPSQFKYTDGTSDRFHHGLIAQEVKESMGEDDWGLYVDTNPSKEGNKGLRYEELITDLIATVQSQNERIKQLERIMNE